MNLETFQIFCDLADTASFTRAAQKNGVTQSAISHQITALERRLHGPLLDRGHAGPGSNISLTPEGQVFLQRSREIIRLAGEMQEEILKMKDTHAESLELAVCQSIALYQLPSLLRQFGQVCPAVAVKVSYGTVARVYEEVREDRMRAGLVSFPKFLPGLQGAVFHKERLVLVCHPQHPLAAGPPVVFRELKGERFIAWTEIPWSLFSKTTNLSVRFYYEPVWRFQDLEAVKQAVESDLGISILPEATVRSEVANQTLAAVPFKGDRFYEPLGVIYREQSRYPQVMENFIQSLKGPAGVDPLHDI